MADPPLLVRDATADDLPAIEDIYNYYVRTSTCTYQLDPGTLDERRAWFDRHGGPHPVTVATRAGEVVGWGALSSFRERWGYRMTVENTVYVRHDRHREGVGRALLADLVERARRLGHHAVIAGISAEQEASVQLHAREGFVLVGRLPEVGHKFDRWLDVLFMEKRL